VKSARLARKGDVRWNGSMALDLLLIAKTIGAVTRGEGAYREAPKKVYRV
jgi:hypothetical protein